jgi:hypothetical protein
MQNAASTANTLFDSSDRPSLHLTLAYSRPQAIARYTFAPATRQALRND